MSAPPWFVLVGGINGAGKSTFTQSGGVLGGLLADLGQEFEVINPDLVTRELREADRELDALSANRAAADESERRLREILKTRRTSVAIETVLSTDKYKPIFGLAQESGFRILFVYVLLGSVEQAIRRVRVRVGRGGHDVPEAKIRSRWSKSLANVPWFWGEATLAAAFYNGGAEPVLIAKRTSEQTSFNPEAFSLLLAPKG